jgi:hypothetical protein
LYRQAHTIILAKCSIKKPLKSSGRDTAVFEIEDLISGGKYVSGSDQVHTPALYAYPQSVWIDSECLRESADGLIVERIIRQIEMYNLVPRVRSETVSNLR